MKWAWLFVLGMGCAGSQASDATPEELLLMLRQVNLDHQVAVQETFEVDVIQGLEDEYLPAWNASTDEVYAMLVERECLGAQDGETGLPAEHWLDSLDAKVSEHVQASHDHMKFSECWGAETDHHHEVVAAIEALEAAVEGCL